MSNKLTKKRARSYAIDLIRKGDATSEFTAEAIAEKLEGMIVELEKRDAAPRKLTEQQKRNEVIKSAIVDFLAANADSGYTISDLIKEVPECAEMTTQHISALVRALNLDSKVEKYVEKRRTYVRIAA